MSTFFASVITEPNGVSAPDNVTLVLKHLGGKATFHFQDSAHMKSVVDTVTQSLMAPAEPVPVLTTPVALAVPVPDPDALAAMAALNLSGSETEYEASEDEAPAANAEPESSFESYGDEGLTQETF